MLEVSSQTSPKQIVIKHGDGTNGSYRGFAHISVMAGQEVKKGDILRSFGDKQAHGLLSTFSFYVWKPVDGESEKYFPIKFDLI